MTSSEFYQLALQGFTCGFIIGITALAVHFVWRVIPRSIKAATRIN